MATIYTRTGDGGDTGLFGGSRVTKQSDRVEAYGTLDEANSFIGLAKVHVTDDVIRTHLHNMQQRLFTVAAEVASDPEGVQRLGNLVDPGDVEALERLIDECVAETGPPRAFVVPGRDEPSALLHVARTLVRRAERRVLTAAESSQVRPEVVKYLNRLSDAMYALGRVLEERYTRAHVEQLVRKAVAEALGKPATGPRASASEAVPEVRALRQAQDKSASLEGFGLGVALVMARAAEDRAAQLGVPIVFAAVDDGGNPLLLHRMTGSLLGSIGLAGDKAWTSVAFQSPTAELTDRTHEGGDIFGLQSHSSGRICVFGGGLPVFVGGRIAGGIGVSGGTVEEDIIIVEHALAAAAMEG